MTVNEALKANSYPGRGILTGKSADGKYRIAVYFIMGRSENSRNRVFERTPDGIRTRAFDEKKLTDPSLIIYSPVRKLNGSLIVTNGDQTDTVYEYMANGKTFGEALRTRCFEPDAPNFTPRISAVMDESGYRQSILKTEDGGKSCMRCFYEYGYESGVLHLIHTYTSDGAPIPSFAGEPRRISVTAADAKTLADEVWSALDEANRVSLYVSFTDESGKEDIVIINKNA